VEKDRNVSSSSTRVAMAAMDQVHRAGVAREAAEAAGVAVKLWF
jgi:hypothetical protein